MNWRSKSNPIAGSGTAGRFDSCFSFFLAKRNVDSRKRMRDSSSDTIDVNFVHIFGVDHKCKKYLYKEIKTKHNELNYIDENKRSLFEIAANFVVRIWLSEW